MHFNLEIHIFKSTKAYENKGNGVLDMSDKYCGQIYYCLAKGYGMITMLCKQPTPAGKM